MIYFGVMITFCKEEVGINLRTNKQHVVWKRRPILNKFWSYSNLTSLSLRFLIWWALFSVLPTISSEVRLFTNHCSHHGSSLWISCPCILPYVFLKCHEYVILLQNALQKQMCHRPKELTDSRRKGINIKVDGIFIYLYEKRWNNEFS